MVVNDSPKVNSRSVRPKHKSNDTNDLKIIAKNDKKHRLKQRFEVIRKLGQGTYGKVQLAINKDTGHEVAIKTIKKSKVESDQDLIRIRREIQIMSSIQHPYIIHIYEVFENRDKIVLVMQYASGGEIYDYVSDRKVLSDSEARRLFRQIATAIYYCHKNKICHRDLKLENILLDEKGNAKIADFGLSNVFDERHFLQTFCGSPLYASPEIVKGLPYYGPEVDCWSLGVLLYTLVYGAMPFDGSNFKRLVKQISESTYFEPKQKSEASELIKRLLTPNPTERATIIDICTDMWVNSGYEHSLLKVAEDLANLTPVRLDILLALAPVSPSAEKLETNCFDLAKDSQESSDNKNEMTLPLNDSITDANTPENNLKKREANPSFDQSLSKFPTQTQTQTPKKKKTKKSQNESQVMTNIDENKDINAKQMQPTIATNDECIAATVGDNQTIDSYIEPQSQQISQNISELKLDSNEKTKHDEIESSLIVNDLKEKTKTTELLEKESVVKEPDIDIKLDDNLKLEIKATNEEIKVINEQKDVKENNSNVINECIIKESEVISEPKENEKSAQVVKCDDKNVDQIESKKDEKKKVKKDRSVSTRRPGKLSIPNIWNKSLDVCESVDSKTSQSSDVKVDRKAPFIPIGFRVSDAKRAFERRCSVPVDTSPPMYSSIKRRESTIGELNEAKRDNTIRQRAPKLSTRSMSLNAMLESPKRVQELLKNTDNTNEKIIVEMKKDSEENKTEVICESPELAKEVKENDLIKSPVLDKSMAKDILTKRIAKAKLMEKRNNSPSKESTPSTTPLVAIENSDVSILSEPSFFRKPRPYAKEDVLPTIDKVNDTDVNTKLNETPQNLNLMNCKDIVTSNDTNTESNDIEKLDSTQSVQTKAAPIARSYKKVTFTKEGACITETGKIYSSEGVDGSYTRVEKKSKVTHFPYEDQTNKSLSHESSHVDTRDNNVQRSDSQSSSGSLDIFDDIFDNHWCGDSIFPNMKSLLHSVVGNRKSRRRSRAESCERNASDWFDLKKSDQESEDGSTFSRSIWPTARPSLFDKSSVFSKHFDKDFNNFDDLNHSIRELSRSVSKDRTSFESRIHPKSYKVFGPQTSVRTDRSADPFETEDIYNNSSKSLLNNNSSHKFGSNRKFWSQDSDSLISDCLTNLRKIDSFESPIRRVEQWLQSDNNDDNLEQMDTKTPFSMYATVGPRGVRRYLRTISSRTSSDKSNNELTNSVSNTGGFVTNSGVQQQSTPLTQSATVPTDSVIEMKFTLNPNNSESNRLNDSNTTSPDNYMNRTSEPSVESSDDNQCANNSNIVLPESSSLLDQLRTHGYRNIVSQRLSGSSIFSDLDSNYTENDMNYKRGKSVLNSTSNGINGNAIACQCMDQTNLMATSSTKISANTSSTTSEADIATNNANAINSELKACDLLNYAKLVDNRNTLNDNDIHCVDQTVTKQYSEPSSTSTARKSYNSETSVTDDLPECTRKVKPNPTTNESIDLKESVQERIHRKSFYSRFNDRPVLPARNRRRSFIDSDDLNLVFGTRASRQTSLTRGSQSFRHTLSSDDNHSNSSSKMASHSSDWFNRMESRVSQLMDDLRSDTTSSFGNHFTKLSDNNLSFGSRSRSSSTTRTAFSTPRSYKSDFDSYFNSLTNSLNNNQNNQKLDNNNANEGEVSSPQEVIQKAIDILSQND